MSCDCCERASEDVSCYPTVDEDAVTLCGECVVMLRDMVHGSEMEGVL